MRLISLVLFLACGLVQPLAWAGCISSTQLAKNRDGSRIRLTEKQCVGSPWRQVWVRYRGALGRHSHTVLRIDQDATEAPTGGASVRDLDGDGLHEVELRGMCGAGPNCAADIYRLNAKRTQMVLFFSGGYADLTTEGPYLVESGRSSCCSWEHHVYQPRSPHRTVRASDLVYRVVVGLSVVSDVDDGTTCTFFNSLEKVVLPARRRLLRLCEVYGPDYVLAKPVASTR